MSLRGWAVLAAGLLGCAHSGTSAPETAAAPPAPGRLPESARYFPLAVGNHWTYEATYLNQRSTQRVEIVSFRDGSYVDNSVNPDGSKGRELRIDAEGIRDQVRYLLHEPLRADATWTSVVAPGSAEHYKVISVHVPCEAPAGRFPDCIVVESRTLADPRTPGRLLVNRVTFAAGVGIVQVKTALEEGSKSAPQAELRLTSFEVAPVR
jgi:hypothetical protein